MGKFFGPILLLSLVTLSCQNRSTSELDQNKSEVFLEQITRYKDSSLNNQLSRSEKIKLLKIGELFSRDSLPDSLKPKAYNILSLGYKHRYLRDTLNFKRVNKLALALGEKFKDSVEIMNSLWDLGDFSKDKGVADSAFFYYNKALKISHAINDSLSMGILWRFIGNQQNLIHDYAGADRSFINALRIFKNLKSEKNIYKTYSRLAINSKDLNYYDDALNYYNLYIQYLIDSSAGTATSTKDLRGAYNSLGNLYRKMGDLEKAKAYYFLAFDNGGLKQVDPKEFSRVALNYGNTLLQLSEFDSAFYYIDESYKIRKQFEDNTTLDGNYLLIGKYFIAKNDNLTALKYIDSCLAIAWETKNNEYILEALNLKAQLEPEKSATHLAQKERLNDSILRAERGMIQKFGRIELETEEYIALAEATARQKQLWVGITIGVLLLALSVFIIIGQNIRNQRLKFQQAQQQSNQEIFDLMLSQNEKIEQGKQKIQKQISEDLHDGVLGEMNGVRMILLGLNKKADDAAVLLREQALNKLQQVQEEIRSISHKINDAAYQKFHNFIVSLEELFSEFDMAHKLPIEFCYNQDMDWDALPAEVKVNLYRIIQECLQNIVKHAQAQSTHITMDIEQDSILVRIRDDGKGFVPRSGKKGIGQKNINSRIAALKGTWKIGSELGKGTTVELNIPYISDSKAKKETVI